MKQVCVKINKTKTVHTVTPSSGAPYKITTGGEITLAANGQGSSNVTTTAKDAKLEFIEVPDLAGNDVAKKERVIGTLTGTIKENNHDVEFDVGAGSITVNPLPTSTSGDSEFFLKFTVDDAKIKNGAGVGNLVLPWEVDAENDCFEVRFRLTVGGVLEADVNVNDSLDVPLKHTNVPENGTGTKTFDSFGISTVYPKGNNMLSTNQRIPFGSATLNVFLHESVEVGCNAIEPRKHKNCFVLADVAADVTTLLTAAGFSKVNVVKVADKDPSFTNLWQVHQSGRFIAMNVPDPDKVGLTHGTNIDYFDFWVVFETGTTVAGASGEAGRSELLNPLNKVNGTKGTKCMVAPIVFDGTSGGQLENSVIGCISGEERRLFANLIAHEIGHTFGLVHTLDFDGSSYSRSSSGRYHGTMGLLQVSGGRVRLQHYGPVHVGVIKKHFL